ncbi:hypothetical protein ACIRSU_03345 [Streptomyces sp. NPDC101160]|uniref:hypothetical protein n=1 Tax=Streptomyces sp. NPDC101160 TaxID=3366118 RepID=UPI003807EA6A
MPQAKSTFRTTLKVLALPALVAAAVAAFRRFPGGGTPQATSARRFPAGGTPLAGGSKRRFPAGGTG